MAVDAKKTIAVGRCTGFVVMLAQTGSPTRAGPETVGVFQTAVTPHAGDGVDTVLGVGGTADVDHSLEGSSAAMTVVTAGVDIRVIQVGGVETGSPVETLCHRYIGTGLPETGVTLGALSHRTDRVRVELVRSGVARPEGYGARGQQPHRGNTKRTNGKQQ